ncbi:histidinol-phosphatase [Candidatus Bathyarchaeota archaeon]|nr:MAG: histidinol-phosphatase [Candidatus Bathyarchaeota archaeon]
MIRIDLHLHTFFSGDSTISPKFIVNQLYSHPFIKGVAITDHDTLDGYIQVRKLAAPYRDILIVPGIEVSTQWGHINILGVEEKPEEWLTIEGVVDFAKERGGVIILPHPYRGSGVNERIRDIPADAIEVFNPHATYEQNKMAEKMARARNLPEVAGSDAHDPQEMWTAYTEVKAELSVESVLNAIRKGLTKPKSVKQP